MHLFAVPSENMNLKYEALHRDELRWLDYTELSKLIKIMSSAGKSSVFTKHGFKSHLHTSTNICMYGELKKLSNNVRSPALAFYYSIWRTRELFVY